MCLSVFKLRTATSDTKYSQPGPLCDKLWRCRPSVAAWIWAAWREVWDGRFLNQTAVLQKVVSAAGQLPPSSAPCISSRRSCSRKRTYSAKLFRTACSVLENSYACLRCSCYLDDSDSFWRNCLRVRLTFSAASFSEITQSCRLLSSSSNPSIITSIPQYRCVLFPDSQRARWFTGHVTRLFFYYFLKQLSSQTYSHMLPPRGRSVIVAIHRFSNLKCTGLQKKQISN